MRKILTFLVMVQLFTSCNLDKTPKCGDSDVVNKAIELFNQQIKEKLKNEYVDKNFNEYDAIEYAKNKGWNTTDYLKTEKNRINTEADEYVNNTLKSTVLKSIRSNSINKEIKLCSCSAEVANLNLKNIDVDYTAQQTEDKEKSIFVELTYSVK